MKNVTGHTLEWSMQSVSQYDTAIRFVESRFVKSKSLKFRSVKPVRQISSADSSPSNPKPAARSRQPESLGRRQRPKTGTPARFNHDFWTFTPANPSSSYLNRYHVRFGPAENSAVSVRDDGLFAVHYVHMAAELWLDSTEGWLAVVDGGSRYAMVERFQYESEQILPGKSFRHLLDQRTRAAVEAATEHLP